MLKELEKNSRRLTRNFQPLRQGMEVDTGGMLANAQQHS
jgi:hypothetical protein